MTNPTPDPATINAIIDAVAESGAEALYLSERAPSTLPVKPWADAAPEVKDHCRRRARAVLGAAASTLLPLPGHRP